MPSTPADSFHLVAARDGAVVCDLSPMAVLAITGPDAAAFLHGQLSNDVTGLAADACQYTSYNSPGGRMLANFVLWRSAAEDADGFRALLPAELADAIRKRLTMFVLRSKVTLTDASPAISRYGVGGPRANAAVAAALGTVPPPFDVVRHGAASVLGLPGPRYVVLAPTDRAAETLAALARHAEPAGFAAWQWLTVRAGVPVITAATQDKFVAQTANWDALGGVHFQKGCYPGQEIIARTQYLGRLKERLHAFHADAATVAPGARLYSPAFDDQPCGTVVNAAVAPGGGTDLLAVLQLAAAASGDVRLGAADGPRLVSLALPYALPVPADPRGRIAAGPAAP